MLHFDCYCLFLVAFSFGTSRVLCVMIEASWVSIYILCLTLRVSGLAYLGSTTRSTGQLTFFWCLEKDVLFMVYFKMEFCSCIR